MIFSVQDLYKLWRSLCILYEEAPDLKHLYREIGSGCSSNEAEQKRGQISRARSRITTPFAERVTKNI